MAVALTPKRKLKTGINIDKKVIDNVIAHVENVIETTYTGGIDDAPVDGATTKPISSNYMYDHVAASDPHAGYVLESVVGSLGASCWVVSSTAGTKVKAFATLLQANSYPVWVCDGTNDQTEIQAAITAATGDVALSAGTFNASDITVNNGTLIGQGDNTVVNVTGTITVSPGGRLHNLKVVAADSYTGTAILVTNYAGAGAVWEWEKVSDILDGVYVYCGTATGIGIKIYGNERGIMLASFGSIIVDGFETGFYLLATETTGSGYLNGVNFESIIIRYSKYLMTLNVASPADMEGNIFSSVQLQPHPTSGTVDGLTFTGKPKYNLFRNLVIWDWAAASGYAVKLGADTVRNSLYGDLVYSISDLGTGNFVYDTRTATAKVIDARCDDAINSGDATTDGVIDALRDAMITHGLIAAA